MKIQMLLILLSSCFMLLTVFLFLLLKRTRKNFQKETTVLSNQISQISQSSSTKIQVLTHFSRILTSSFDRNRILAQIISELNSYFSTYQIRVVLRTEQNTINLSGTTENPEGKVLEAIPFTQAIKAAESSGKQALDGWESILDSGSLLVYFYSFPLLIQEKLQGYLVVSSNNSMDTNDNLFFSDIASLISSVLQNILTVREKNYINEQFGRSVDPRVRDYLLNSKEDGHVLSVSVLFFDIRNFTTLSEKLGPVETVRFLNQIFTLSEEIIREEGGFINKFTGDGFMAVFGAPVTNQDHEKQAVKSALKILKGITIPVGIGIASGEAVAGTIGSTNRKEYTVIGDTVNTASRVEGMCKIFGSSLVVTSNTLEKASECVEKSRFLGTVRLKGKATPIQIFDLLTENACYESEYSDAVSLYYKKDFIHAQEKLKLLSEKYTSDKAIAWYLTKCDNRINNPVEWDGVEQMTEK